MISVVIPNYNGAEVLEACLLCLARQTVSDFEVILVDNGSRDRSLELAARVRPDVRTLVFERNRGFAAAVNAGIRAARGRYVALLNNDVQVEPDWLEALVEALEADPLVFAAGPKMLLDPERHRINVVGIKLKPNAESGSIGAGQEDRGQYDRPGQVFGVSAGAALYRRDVFEDVGLFDEDFFAYLEDVDLSFRARLLGYRFRYAPRARAYHLKGWTTRKKMPSAFEIRLNARNVLLCQVKNLPAGAWQAHRARILGRHLELFFRHTVQRLYKGDARPYLTGKMEFLRMREAVLAKRRAVQAARRVPDEAITFWLGREVVVDGEETP
ncbi:MAG: glycosyltransferase family 2 protein [Proteobacteria bacterium]|nr:glycosyltransferase family 2 protein [Pseudomonadota bacterium]